MGPWALAEWPQVLAGGSVNLIGGLGFSCLDLSGLPMSGLAALSWLSDLEVLLATPESVSAPVPASSSAEVEALQRGRKRRRNRVISLGGSTLASFLLPLLHLLQLQHLQQK